jgi:hypothetical protein
MLHQTLKNPQKSGSYGAQGAESTSAGQENGPIGLKAPPI